MTASAARVEGHRPDLRCKERLPQTYFESKPSLSDGALKGRRSLQVAALSTSTR